MRAVLRSLILLLFACACPISAHAVNCALSSGASVSTIQTALNAAGSNSCDVQTVAGVSLNGSTVLFQSGNYSITSQLSVPCPNTPMVIEGVPPSGVGTKWPITPPAILTSSLTNNWAFSGHACSNGVTFQYLQYNGGQPAGGGGGFLYVPPGMNNLTVIWNWFYGNSALQTTSQEADAFIWIDGTYGTHTQNTTIQWNRFGFTGSGDCGGLTGLMTLYGSGGGPGTCSASGYAPPSGTHSCLYQGEANLNGGGGYCAAVGIHNNTDNLLIANNSIQEQEQAFKCFENSGGVSSTNTLVSKNDLSGIHRIGYESQCNDGQVTADSNDFHDPYFPNANQWALSLPEGSTSSTNNVLIANVASPNDRNGNPGSYSGCGIEFWGNETSSQNLIQGLWCAGIEWGLSNNTSTWSANNNITQLSAFPASAGIEDEGYHTSPAPAQTGNILSGTISALTSTAPTISPTPTGTYSSPITITLTDNGITSGAGPRGNVSIYYTTDGSTPAINQGTTKFYTGTFMVAPGSTVKALGMWGALNQPASYPASYGFVPSAVQTAFYAGSGGSTPTLTGIALTCPSTALTAGASTEQCLLTCNYSDSSHFDCTGSPDIYGHGPGAYASSQPSTVAISGTAVVTPVAAGAANLTATIGALTSVLPVSVAASGGGGGGSPFLGNNQEDSTGITYTGCFNSVYAISPPYPTTVGQGHFFAPTDTVTSGAHYDLLIIAAPTSTTEASSAICKGTFTNPGSSAANAFVNVTMSGCGTIAANTPYWIAGITDDASAPNLGFSDCGGTSCPGSAPTTYGTGTFPGAWICGLTYGSYSSLPSALNAHTGSQVSHYIDLIPTGPTLTTGYQDNTLSVSTMTRGSAFTQHAYCVYSDGLVLQCDTADTRGNAVTAWTENSGGTVLSIGAVGGGTPGLVTGVNYGQAVTHCTLTGGIPCSPYVWNVTNQPATSIVIQGAKLSNVLVNR